MAEPESVIFGQSDGRQPSYNVQLTVDVETQVIIESEPVGNPSDSGQLAPTARRLAPILGVRAALARGPRASRPRPPPETTAVQGARIAVFGWPDWSRMPEDRLSLSG